MTTVCVHCQLTVPDAVEKAGTHYGVDRLNFDQSFIEDCPQITGVGHAESGEVVEQRCVEQRKLVVHVIQPFDHRLCVSNPEFAYAEDIFTALVSYMPGHSSSVKFLNRSLPELRTANIRPTAPNRW